MLKKIPYELWKGYKPNISYFRVFGSKYSVLNEILRNTKFNPKSTEGIFVGYSITSKAYKVYIVSSRIVVESMHVKFDEYTNKRVYIVSSRIVVESMHVKFDEYTNKEAKKGSEYVNQIITDLIMNYTRLKLNWPIKLAIVSGGLHKPFN
jgi:hypothetical protein